ncbi:MAG: type II secretion system protein J [Candidatus Gracilibacteria bacterium]
MTIKKGFTLMELIISIAIFLLIFTMLTQGFLTVLKISHQIEVNRELTLYSSKILNALSTDIDELKIDTSNNTEINTSNNAEALNSFTLQNNDGTKRIVYTLEIMKNSDIDTYYKDRKLTETLKGKDVYTLIRKVDNEEPEPYISDNFVLTNPHFIKSPSTSLSRCKYIPALTFSATVVYVPKLRGDNVQTSSYLQTTFSTPEDPLQFSQSCK